MKTTHVYNGTDTMNPESTHPFAGLRCAIVHRMRMMQSGYDAVVELDATDEEVARRCEMSVEEFVFCMGGARGPNGHFLVEAAVDDELTQELVERACC